MHKVEALAEKYGLPLQLEVIGDHWNTDAVLTIVTTDIEGVDLIFHHGHVDTEHYFPWHSIRKDLQPKLDSFNPHTLV